MSHEKFKEARRSLQHSQQILDQLRTPQQPMQEAPQPPQEMQQGVPQTPPEAPPQEETQQEEKGIIQGVTDALKPMFEDIKALFQKKETEPKEATVALDATIEPKKKE